MTRDFKGVWIPKEIWLDENLTIMEKVFLTEIDSLDTYSSCFASNSYFANFFGLGVTRTSQIINTLIKKGYIEAEYEREGREIVKRVLTVKCKKVFNKVYEGIQESVTRYPVKCRDNNTTNNTINNKGLRHRDSFSIPTLIELTEYCKMRNNSVDSQQFLDFYEAKGWMIGKNKMKNWQAAVRTWEKRDGSIKNVLKERGIRDL